MNILDFLDALEDELESGSTMPFTGKALIDRDICLDIIRDIRLNLPDEIKQAEWIKNEKQRILMDAQKQAELTIKEAEQHMKSLIEENEITQKAYQQSKEIIENAQNAAKEIRLGARDYADAFLDEVEGYIREQLDMLVENRKQLKSMKK